MKLLVLCVLIALLTGCTINKQQKAEELVKKYMASYLNDVKSYQSVNFKPIDTIFWDYSYTVDGHKISATINYYRDKFTKDLNLSKKWSADVDSGQKEINTNSYKVQIGEMDKTYATTYLHNLTKSSNETKKKLLLALAEDTAVAKKEGQLIDEFNKKNKNFRGPIKRWLLIHTFRAKNSYGAMVLQTIAFSIDSGITKVMAETVIENQNSVQ